MASRTKLNMPKRPRSHQLETETRRELARILPSSWIMRDVADDYGVDCEIEIFSDGQATAELIKVQLKGTDKRPSKRGVYSVVVGSEKLAYWIRLDVPVLIILFASSNRTLYARWAQSYDPYPAEKIASKTVTIGFSEQNRLHQATLAFKLRKELNAIRSLRDSQTPFETSLFIETTGKLSGIKPEQFLIRLRAALVQANGLVRLVDTDADADARLVIGDKEIRMAARGDIATVTLHVGAADHTGPNAAYLLANDAVDAITLFFLHLNRVADAASIALSALRLSRMANSPNGMATLFHAFMEESMLSEAWSLIRGAFMYGNQSLKQAASLWLGQLTAHDDSKTISTAQRLDMINAIKVRIAQAGELADGRASALLHSQMSRQYSALAGSATRTSAS